MIWEEDTTGCTRSSFFRSKIQPFLWKEPLTFNIYKQLKTASTMSEVLTSQFSSLWWVTLMTRTIQVTRGLLLTNSVLSHLLTSWGGWTWRPLVFQTPTWCKSYYSRSIQQYEVLKKKQFHSSCQTNWCNGTSCRIKAIQPESLKSTVWSKEWRRKWYTNKVTLQKHVNQ